MKKKIIGMLAAAMLTVSTMQVAAAEVPAGTENLSYTYEDIDGGEFSTQSSGKPKILVFFKTTCGHCRTTLRDIASSDWLKNGEAEVCAIEISFQEADEVRAFRDAYCAGSNIKFASTAENDSLANSIWSYSNILDIGNSLTTPLVVMIDSNNEIRGVSTGTIYASEIQDTYLPVLNSGSDDTTDSDDTQKPGDSTDSDDTQNPGDSTDSDDTQNPGDSTDSDDTQNPGDTTDPDGVQNPGDTTNPDDSQNSASTNKPSKPDSSDKTDVSKKSDDSQDAARAAEEMEKLYKNSPGVKYAEYLKEMSDALLNTKQNEFVISTNTWTCFNRTMLNAIKSRPDVTVTVNYIYEGKPCTLVIPAGTDVSQLMDENGFAGFRYIEKMLNAKN